MDLRSECAFWPIEAGLLHVYPTLRRDETCDVAIIGAGITGALVARRLSGEGLSCVVVDTRDIGGGSTSASTALLQYEVDVPLCRLMEQRGKDHAVRSYQLCAQAINSIERLAGELPEPCEFRKVPSLYLASRKEDREELEKEYETRRAFGFDVSLLSEKEIGLFFPFSAPAALWTEHAGQINPYRFAHALLASAAARGVRIFDRTKVLRYERHSRGVTLGTGAGPVIEARKAVFATGYEAPEFLAQDIVTLKSTYAVISEPSEISWHRTCLVWETARPYLYLRKTPQGRILLGGEDEDFSHPAARDALIGAKTEALLGRFGKMFPGGRPEPAYAWAGTFAETKDGLGYIGENAAFPNGYFALGYGGNGMTYGVIASEILGDLILGRPNPDAAIFRFDR